MARYLALDQGGHASRAILFERGTAVGQAFVPVGTRRTEQGFIEHDADELVESLRTAISDLGVAGSDIAAAGMATQRSSIACWDRETGRALSPVISWQDRRNAAFVARLQNHAAAIHACTGLVLSPHYGASKLRWCLDNVPEVMDAAARGRLACGPLSSFLLFRLLEGRPLVVDPANACRTQLWDPATRDWAPMLLDLFGVPRAHLPRPVPSRYRYGSLSLPGRSVPLVVCTGDQSCVPFAFGPTSVERAYVNMGTGAFIQCPLEEPVIAPPMLTSVVWSDESGVTYVLEGSVNGAASALDWFGETEGVDAQRMLASLDSSVVDTLKPPLFLNGISGLGSPFWVADFASRFEGNGTLEQRFIAVLESILFLIRVNLDEIQHHRSRLQHIVVTGGLAASTFLCQRLASLAGVPVVRYAEREATARGLAYLIEGQPPGWPEARGEEVFAPEENTALLERFFAWLKEMKQVTRGQSTGV